MESPQSATTQKDLLKNIRETLLTLHKAVLDSERTRYEMSHGPVGSPSAFLQLLINDPWFSWLRPVTTMVVEIDEALAKKDPPAGEQDFSRLIGDTRALLSPSREEHGFWEQYQGVVRRDPAVAVLQQEIEKQFA